jgi:thiol-disulfide isomerase/thioredoxin
MAIVLLVARLLLAAVFAVAALTRLADLAGSRQDLRGFRQLHSSPAGWPTLARNTVLTAIPVFVLWQGPSEPGLSAVEWLSDTSAVERIALAASLIALGLWVIQGLALVNLVGKNGRLRTRLEAIEAAQAANRFPMGDSAEAPTPAAAPVSAKPGLPVGTPAPTFTLPGLYGEKLTLESLYANGVPALLVFMNSGCGACNTLLPDIARWQREQVNALSVAVIGRGSAEANRARATKHGLTRFLLQQDREVAAGP